MSVFTKLIFLLLEQVLTMLRQEVSDPFHLLKSYGCGHWFSLGGGVQGHMPILGRAWLRDPSSAFTDLV